MQVIDKITGDVKHYLKSLNGTQNVVLLSNPPLSSEAISEWELTNNATLPSDLKAFFMVCNGLTLKWSASLFTQANQDPLLSVNPNVSHTANPPNSKTIQAGNGSILSCKDLKRVRLDCVDPKKQYADRMKFGNIYFDANEEWSESSPSPPFPSSDSANPKSEIVAFAIDHNPDLGVVCLLLDGTSASVWLKEKSCRWHPLASDFTSYFRLMLVHLAIQGWQFAFTDIGLPPYCKALLSRFAPERLLVDLASLPPPPPSPPPPPPE
ncbi:hypothetical protein ScalyP_jg2780 [Parmales sp. scaly parma]|nr:hypothetical protein ScalyP_jg2780 [Parmales sp. scaly parma]